MGSPIYCQSCMHRLSKNSRKYMTTGNVHAWALLTHHAVVTELSSLPADASKTVANSFVLAC